MALALSDLDDLTRSWMLREFEAEEAKDPYRSKLLTLRGRTAFGDLMREAIRRGDDESLADELANPEYWLPTEPVGQSETRRVNLQQAAKRLAQIEFNTWYVRGFAARLQSEGVTQCRIVRARERSWDPECDSHDGAVVPVESVIRGHRARYWPAVQPVAFSIPTSPGRGHSIART